MSTRPAFLRLFAATALFASLAFQPLIAGAQETLDASESVDDVSAEPTEPTDTTDIPDYIYAGFDEARISEPDAVDQLRLADDVDQELGVTEVSPGQWMIPFEAVSLGSGVRLAGEISEASLTVPVPQGLTPSTMRATMTLSPDVDSGFIEYSGQGSPTRTLELDGALFRNTAIEVELDLSRFEVVNNQIRISFRSRLRSEDDACTTNLIGSYVDFRSGVFLLSGQPEPADTVASFVPRLLENLTIALPEEPTSAEAKLATAFAITATKTAIGNAPTIDVVSFDSVDNLPTPSDAPTDRLVVISHELEAGLNVVSIRGGQALAIGGDDAQMEQASDLALDPLLDLAIGTEVDVFRVDLDSSEAELRMPDQLALQDEADAAGVPLVETDSLAEVEFARDKRFSLRDLDITGTKLVGVGRMEMPLSVTQASLGGSVSSVRIYLTGVYTPVEAPASGSATFSLGGKVVATILLDESGEFTVDVTVPEHLMSRTISILGVVEYAPAGGCGVAFAPSLTFQVDPDESLVLIEEGEVLPPTFERYPTAFVEDFNVGLDRFDVERVELAIRTITALQRVSSVVLEPTYMLATDALALDEPALVVSAPTPGIVSAHPLLALDPMSAIDKDRVERLQLDVNLPYAVMQSFEDNGNNRLLLSWSGGTQGTQEEAIAYADQLVDSFSTRDENWNLLFGDTYLISEGTPPLSLNVRGEDIQLAAVIAPPDYMARAVPLAVGGTFIIVVGYVMNLVRLRRVRKIRAAKDQQL